MRKELVVVAVICSGLVIARVAGGRLLEWALCGPIVYEWALSQIINCD